MELEQKLALIEQMRQQQNGSCRPRKTGSFRVRFLLAAFLFLLFFYMDVRNVALGSIDSTKIQSYVSDTLSLSSLPILVNDIH